MAENIKEEINKEEYPEDISNQERDFDVIKDDYQDKEPKRDVREEIESIDLKEELKEEAATQANSIKTLQDDEKIKRLLEIAKKKGVVFSVNVAKKTGDAYILDTLHDLLAKEGYYKNF